jgi:hypothetical protein
MQLLCDPTLETTTETLFFAANMIHSKVKGPVLPFGKDAFTDFSPRDLVRILSVGCRRGSSG